MKFSSLENFNQMITDDGNSILRSTFNRSNVSLLDVAYAGCNMNGPNAKVLLYERVQMEKDQRDGKNPEEVER